MVWKVIPVLFIVWLQTSLASDEFRINVRRNPGDQPRVGGVLRRECIGYPQSLNWQYSWRYPDGTVRNGRFLNVNVLRNSQLGTYRCTATAGVNTLVTFSTPSEETSAPMNSGSRTNTHSSSSNAIRLDISPLNGENLSSGGTIRRQCLPNQRSWNVYWKKPNGERVNSPYLIVENLSAANGGRYTCHASDPATGRTTSRYFDVNIYRAARLNIRALGDRRIRLGRTLRRACTVDESGWDVYWTLPNGRRINSQYLIVDDLKTTDAGRYTCHARKPSTGATLSSWFEFTTRTATQTTNVIRVEPQAAESIRIGGQLNRQCVVRGSGWQVYWSLPNGRTLNSRHLVVRNLSSRDVGTYTCHASNAATGASWSKWFRFTMPSRSNRNSAVLRLEDLPDQDLRYGGTLSQWCSVNRAGWTIRWQYPNGRIVHGGRLRVTNLSQRDFGRYNCYARKTSTGEQMSAYYNLSP